MIRVCNIDWDITTEDVITNAEFIAAHREILFDIFGLPDEVEIDDEDIKDDNDEEAINDYLSELYNFTVNDYATMVIDDNYD